MNKIKIGIIGGSGFYDMEAVPTLRETYPMTPFGLPSAAIKIKVIEDIEFAFLPRHGNNHTIPPHKIPYRANIEALRLSGVTHIIGVCIAGSLSLDIEPSHFVIPNQLVHFTWGRDDDFIENSEVEHLPFANPYCAVQNNLLFKLLQSEGLKVHSNKTVVVTQGTRFATVAESRFFTAQGWDLINMTQYPEGYFARKLGICYSSIAMITDFDVGIKQKLSILNNDSMSEILEIFHSNNKNIKSLLYNKIKQLSEDSIPNCSCRKPYPKEYYKS